METVLLYLKVFIVGGQKPVHLLRDPWRHSYRRVGEADMRCSTEEVEEMLRLRSE